MSNYGEEGGKQKILLVTYFVLAICVHEGYESFFFCCAGSSLLCEAFLELQPTEATPLLRSTGSRA